MPKPNAPIIIDTVNDRMKQARNEERGTFSFFIADNLNFELSDCSSEAFCSCSGLTK